MSDRIGHVIEVENNLEKIIKLKKERVIQLVRGIYYKYPVGRWWKEAY